MASDVSDFDVSGADISFDALNLDPSSGDDPGRVPRNVVNAAKEVYPDASSEITVPLSVVKTPKGAENNSLAPRPGAPVNLAPPNPIQMAQTPKVETPQIDQVAPALRAPAAAPQGGQRPGTGQGLFGSERIQGPTPDANANPLQMQKDAWKAQADRLMERGNDKTYQFWNAKSAREDREQAAELYGKINETDQKIQAQQTNVEYAKNFGLTGPVRANQDAAATHELALNEWRTKGNYNAFQALHGAGQGARADLYMPEGMEALGRSVSKANSVYSRLGDATSEQDYLHLRNQELEKAKDDPNAKKFGLTDNALPKTKAAFEARKDMLMGPLNQAGQFVSKYQQQLANQGVPKPITQKEIAEPVVEQFKHADGDKFAGTQAVTLENGQQGAMAQPGSKDLANFGPHGYNNMNDANRKTIRETLAGEQEKGAINQYKMAKSFHEVANNDKLYRSAAGQNLIADELGALGRDVAEGSKAAGSIGLVKMLDEKYGSVEKFLNMATTNWAAYKEYVQSGKKGPEVKLTYNRLTDQSIQGIKDVADFKYKQTFGELSRLEGPISQLGKYGGSLSEVGLDKPTQELLKPIHEEALQRARLAQDKYDAKIYGDRRIFLPQGTKGEGIIPAGSYEKSIKALSKNVDPEVKVTVPTPGPPSKAGNDGIFPGAPGSGGPGGYAAGIRAGESSNNYQAPPPVGKDGKKLSTASGAYQFTDETWAANKPPGAPDQAYKATAKDQDAAFATLTAKNSAALVKANVPANPLTLAMAHQQGAGGAIALAKAPEDANAKDFVDRKAAANNAAFFWDKEGKPLTVAESKAKFAQHYRTEGGVLPTQNAESAKGPLPYPNPKNRQEALANYNAGQRMTEEEKAQSADLRRQRLEQSTRSAAHIAPAALGTAGAVIGSAAGPVGSVLGGTGGGVLGGGIENYFTGAPDQQNIPGYAKAGAIGGAKGLVAGIPGGGVLPTAARVVGSGLVGGGEEALKGGDVPSVVNAAGGSMLGAAAGEAFGQALGMAGHQIYSRFSGVAKNEIQDAARTLHEQQAKVMDATGKMVENKAYTAAEKTIKTAGLDPEHAAYAYGTVTNKATKGEAFTQRPGAIEQREAGKELERIKGEVGDAGAAAGVKPWAATPGMPPAKIKGGPVESINTGPTSPGKIAKTYLPEAQQAEDWLQKKTANVGEWWGNAASARSELLQHERDAITAGNTHRADAMRDIANTVREQQKNMAYKVLPKDKADVLMADLAKADVRYRNAMDAGGKDIVKTIAGGGAAGNKAKDAFDALAGSDTTAKRYMNALTTAEARKDAKGLGVMIMTTGALHFVPVVGQAASAVSAVVTIAKAKQMATDWMVKRGAGQRVSFKDLMLQDTTVKQNLARSGGAAIGSAVGNQQAQDYAASP